MRLNAQTDYSLRLMMFLASTGGRAATIREISSKLGLSQTHMMRIAARLASKGLVNAARGRSGGLALGRAASLISVDDIVDAIEPDFALVHCLQTPQKHSCTIEQACALKGVLSSAVRAFRAELRSVSLADVTQADQLKLVTLFQLDDPGPLRERRARRAAEAAQSASGRGAN